MTARKACMSKASGARPRFFGSTDDFGFAKGEPQQRPMECLLELIS
jgi:hypothetical protein